LVHAAFAQNSRPFARVVGRIRPALVIEIVNQTSHAPGFEVFAEVRGVMPHAGLDRERVLISDSDFVNSFSRFQASSRVMVTPASSRLSAGRVLDISLALPNQTLKYWRMSRSRRGNEAELFFAPKSASSRRRLPFSNSPCER